VQLDLSDEQELLRRTFADLFAVESSPERVRAAEPLGFDAALWKQLAEAGLFGIRVPAALGGENAGLLEASLVADEGGRRLVSGPMLEAIVAARLLAAFDCEAARSLLPLLLDGSGIVTIAFRDFEVEPCQLVPGGAIADAVIGITGRSVVLLRRDVRLMDSPRNLGSSPIAHWDSRECPREDLGRGLDSIRIFQAVLEEWKVLAAAALAGLGREALEIAGRYSCEREQFGRPIGSFQGVAHPLAESVSEVEGARWLTRKAIWSLSVAAPNAAALVSMSLLAASDAATRAVARALHTHGGYGLSLDYDIQLYHRRAKAIALPFGDPQILLGEIADRTWPRRKAAPIALPDVGAPDIDFGLGADAEAFAEMATDFFEENLDDELRAHAHFAWEGHHPGFQRKLADAGLLFPSWPREYGGQGRSRYELYALYRVMREFGWTTFAISTTYYPAMSLLEFGSEALKQEVLPRVTRGDAIICLGYSEPGSGSDVAAAQTRAVRDGKDWLINGQKMFTSGAERAQYVFLLTRTDPQARKHDGLTMFLVPLDLPGIEIQAVHTLSDERTNLTYYNDVRVPDRYRVGEVNGGWTVVAYALELEHGGGYPHEQADLLQGAVEWAQAKLLGGVPAIELPRVRERLARAAMHAEIAEVLGARALFATAEGRKDSAIGPMARIYSADRFIEDSADLMDLCAPDSLLQGRPGGQQRGAAAVEFRYRLSTACAIYGGTTEIMKSIVAQTALGMPRSRS
jgi:Acyl-CoA dehydrogenases